MSDPVMLKKLVNPDDEDQWLLVPVRYLVKLIDPKIASWEQIYRINNASWDPRQVHIKMVKNAADLKAGADPTTTDGDRLYVERIDAIFFWDPKTQSQLMGVRLANNDPPPRQWDSLDGDPNLRDQRSVEYVRITANQSSVIPEDQSPDDTPYVTIERILNLPVYDPKTKSWFKIFRIGWPERGDPINDPDDPFNATFERVDVDVLKVDLEDQIDVLNKQGVRLDPFQNIVDIKWGGVIETQVDDDPEIDSITKKKKYDPDEPGGDHSGLIVMRDAADDIDDFKKFTASMFFNVPHPVDTETHGTEYAGSVLCQWGGRPGGSTDVAGLGFPASSFICILPDTGGETNEIALTIQLVSGLNDQDLATNGNSWYDRWPFYTGDDAADPTYHVWIAQNFRCYLGGFKSDWAHDSEDVVHLNDANGFTNTWHSLLVSVDASDADWELHIEPDEQQWIYNRAWECTGIPPATDPHGTIGDTGTRLEWNGFLDANGWGSNNLLYDNGDYLFDIRPNHLNDSGFDIETLILDRFGEDGPTHPARYIIYYSANADDVARYGGTWGVTLGSTLAETTAEFGTPSFAPVDNIKMEVMLDGKIYRGDPVHDHGTYSGTQQLSIYINSGYYAFAPDDRDGFIISGLEPMGFPHSEHVAQAQGFDHVPDVRTRYSKVQMWFGTYVDLTDANVVKKFIERYTIDNPASPDNGKEFLRPAKFAPGELPPDATPQQKLSPASNAFGQPDIYLDGGPGPDDPAADPTGFQLNRGTSSDFKRLRVALNYSPGPNKIKPL